MRGGRSAGRQVTRSYLTRGMGNAEPSAANKNWTRALVTLPLPLRRLGRLQVEHRNQHLLGDGAGSLFSG